MLGLLSASLSARKDGFCLIPVQRLPCLQVQRTAWWRYHLSCKFADQWVERKFCEVTCYFTSEWHSGTCSLLSDKANPPPVKHPPVHDDPAAMCNRSPTSTRPHPKVVCLESYHGYYMSIWPSRRGQMFLISPASSSLWLPEFLFEYLFPALRK